MKIEGQMTASHCSRPRTLSSCNLNGRRCNDKAHVSITVEPDAWGELAIKSGRVESRKVKIMREEG